MKLWVKIVLGIAGSLAGLYLIMFVANVFCNVGLRNYIKTFEPVEYGENRLVPEKIDGYYTFTTDRDIRFMQLTDIHIGGGFWTYMRDKKAIYEVMTMLHAEKPDAVILTGDCTYALPLIGYNGGNTFNNKMVAKTFIKLMERAQVYYTITFGNHETEAFDYANRDQIGKLYMNPKYKYCFFEQMFSDRDAKTIPSVTNQIFLVKNTAGKITKIMLMIDSNDYINRHFISSATGRYDVIHDAQVDWAADEIKKLSEKEGLPEGQYLKTLAFMHIPFGEFQIAYEDLIEETKDEKGKPIAFKQKVPSKDTEFVEGCWGEIKICYGGINDKTKTPAEKDKFFEVLCDQMHSVEAVFCGHDHTNNAVVKYKGVLLCYGYSVDNIAYKNAISNSGTQRGATVITVKPDGRYSQKHKNAYTDYGCSMDKFVPVYLDKPLYPHFYRTVE